MRREPLAWTSGGWKADHNFMILNAVVEQRHAPDHCTIFFSSADRYGLTDLVRFLSD